MSRFDLVTFVTDYGRGGGFVGALHAVVDALVPPELPVRILDLDHDIPRHDVLLGALRLEAAMGYVRPGVHVAVVDPGVGTARRPVAVESHGRVFVGPDNGLLAFALEATGGATRAVEITRVVRAGATATFDGRDVFAPAAGHLLSGAALSDLGPPLEPAELHLLERPLVRLEGGGRLTAVVLQVDGFGNVQLAAAGDLLAELGDVARVQKEGTAEQLAVSVGRTFADVARNEPVVLSDSDGRIALSVNRGRGDALLGGLARGDVLVLERGDGERARP